MLAALCHRFEVTKAPNHLACSKFFLWEFAASMAWLLWQSLNCVPCIAGLTFPPTEHCRCSMTGNYPHLHSQLPLPFPGTTRSQFDTPKLVAQSGRLVNNSHLPLQPRLGVIAHLALNLVHPNCWPTGPLGEALYTAMAITTCPFS